MNGRFADLVVDTNIVSYILRNAPLAVRYRPLIDDKRIAVSFQTVGELRLGQLLGHYDRPALEAWERLRSQWRIIDSNHEIVEIYAALRADANRAGRELSSQDAWIAATALWLQVPLVSHDRDFRNVPELELITRA